MKTVVRNRKPLFVVGKLFLLFLLIILFNKKELGIGNTTAKVKNIKCEQLEFKKIRYVTGGIRHSIAITEQGKLYSWGVRKTIVFFCFATFETNILCLFVLHVAVQ